MQKALLYNPPPVSKEQFSEWKRNPVTEALFKELVEAFMASYDDTLPEDNIDRGTILAYKRDGALEMINVFLEWEPVKMGDDND